MLSSRYAPWIRSLLACGLLLNAFMVWKDWALIRKGYPDFTIFYSAGTLVWEGQAKSLYEEKAEFHIQLQFAPEVSIRHGALPYNHPPFEALMFAPLTLLPYFWAYVTWNAVNLTLLALALRTLRPHVGLLRTRPLIVWMACALAFFPIFVCFLQGQDMLLLLFLLVAAYASLKQGADFWAGCWLGLGTFRPHLILPLAVIMLFARRWKTIASITISALGMAVVSLAVVGPSVLFDYPKYVWNLEQMMGRGSIVPGDMPNLRGFAAIFFPDGGPVALALVAGGSAALLALSVWLFRRAQGANKLEIGFSAAILITILMSYHAFLYDLALLFLPSIFLVDQVRNAAHVRWQLVAPATVLFFTPLLMFLLLRLSHLNFLTPVLLLWLWGTASEILRPGSAPA